MATISGTFGADPLTGTRDGDLITGHRPLEATSTAPVLSGVVGGLGQAVFAAAAPGDAGHLYVLDKAGLIRIVDTAAGTARPTPFLDITAEVANNGEQGLLGLAFHPDFWSSGRFYVFFSRGTDGTVGADTVLREYRVDPAHPDTVLSGSARDILTVPQPEFTNHKGGWIGFGHGANLYVATGDGGGANDPLGTGQDPNDLLGSILRINVDGDDFPEDEERNYGIPSSNPFADGGGAPEVWAYGLRNPYRDGFDRGTGNLWIGDVGQAAFEEVNIGRAGANYGWATHEGPSGGAPGFADPVFSYDHSAGDASVIGGYVSRGPDSGLFGRYVFGDFVSGRIWTLADTDSDGDLDRTLLDDATTFGPGKLVSFAEDGDGSLYALSISGDIVRISGGTATGVLDGADTIGAGRGDDRVFAGAGSDVAGGGRGDDLLSGMEGDDSLSGGDGADLLIGALGADVLKGGSGADTLLGGADDDRLFGGHGDDLLIGGEGADRLKGDNGADRFRWTSLSDSPADRPLDTVVDFDGAEGDRLDLSALADGEFAFIASAAFAGSGAQVRVVAQGSAERVEISLDGGAADMALLVRSAAPLIGADFIL